MSGRKFTAAAIQMAPELPWSLGGTTEKICHLIREAADKGAELIVFPECYLPMYPNWSVDLSKPAEWAENLADFIEECPFVPGPETEAVGEAARKAGAYVVLGLNERDPLSSGKIFNSLAYFGPEGNLIGLHRKLLPTNREKVFHCMGDGRDLAVYPTRLGRISGLICYEHLQPLAKYFLFSQGEEIHCACWPGWPNFREGRSNVHVIDAMSRATAIEGQVFVVAASLYVPPEAVPRGYRGNADWSFFGGSGIIGPDGSYLAGPAREKETILYAEIDPRAIALRKAAVDTMGKDSRWDLLGLRFQPGRYAPLPPEIARAAPVEAGAHPAENLPGGESGPVERIARIEAAPGMVDSAEDDSTQEGLPERGA